MAKTIRGNVMKHWQHLPKEQYKIVLNYITDFKFSDKNRNKSKNDAINEIILEWNNIKDD